MIVETEKFTINANKDAMRAIREDAKDKGVEASTIIARAIHNAAIATGRMDPETTEMLQAQYKTIDTFVLLARKMAAAREFDEHFVLRVFQQAMADDEIKKAYERAVGGDAYAKKLPGKTPLNMYLGWYIKNAIGADPIVDSDEKTVRAQVRGEPIQTYTLLKMPAK